MSEIRSSRLNEEMLKTVSSIIRDMKDPRLSDMISITSVDMTRDLKYAKVRVSVYDEDDSVRKESVAILNKAAGFIQREVGRRMLIRAVPSMKFILDDSIAYSIHIAEILNSLNIPKAEDTTEEE